MRDPLPGTRLVGAGARRTSRTGARARLALVVAAALLALHGCGGSDGGGGQKDVRAPADSARAQPDSEGAAPVDDGPTYRAVAMAEAGELLGTVRFEGEPPAPEQFSVPEEDRRACGHTVTVRRVVLGAGRGLAGAVVSLRGIRRGRPFSDSSAVLDQRKCRFEPGVVVLPVGGELTVRNSDPVTHNVHTLAFENRTENRSQPTGVDLSLGFEAPERLRVECDIHPWMGASVVVSHHPYHDVTREDGSFGLDRVPPGSYRIAAWHPELGSMEERVTVRPGEATTVSLTLSK